MTHDVGSEAGPSRVAIPPSSSSDDFIAIPSSGVEFFEYRRRIFFAGLQAPTTPSSETLPTHYLVPAHTTRPPPSSSSSSAINKRGVANQQTRPKHESQLEFILSRPGAEELQETWDAGVGSIARSLHAGRRLNRPLKLSLVIKILRASWIQDGTWPKDASGAPVKPPDSPLIEGTDLFPLQALQEDVYPPPDFNDKQ